MRSARNKRFLANCRNSRHVRQKSIPLGRTHAWRTGRARAAVIAVPHVKWQERSLAMVVLKSGASMSTDELWAFLAMTFAKWHA